MTAEVELRLTADLDDASKEVAGFRKEYASLVREVEKPLRQANTFRDVSQSLEGTQRQIGAAKDRLRQLRDEMVRTEAPSKELQADYRNATNELKRLERQESAQIGQLRSYRSELQAAGVDVGNLAEEQRRLSAEFNKRFEAGRSDAALTAARNALGVGEIESAQRKLVELRQQYQLVTRDGNLSAKQRSEAESSYRRNVVETLARLRDLREQSAKQASAEEREAAAQSRRHTQARQGIAQIAAAQRQAAIEARRAAAERARDSLGVNQARSAQQEIANLQRQYDLLRRSGALSTKELAIAQRQLKQRIAETKAELSGLSGGGGPGGSVGAGLLRGAGALGGAGLGARAGVIGAIAGAGAGVLAAKFAPIAAKGADEVGRLDSRLRLAAKSQEEFNTAQLELDRIADVTQGDVSDLVGLYSRLQRPMREAGQDQQATLETIEAVTLGLKIGGASAGESASVIQQFSQAIGSGVLRGEEFNAVLEGSDRIAGALADSLGVTTGELREMAKAGELTASQVTNALRKELPKLRQEIETFAPEIGAAWERITVEMRRRVGRNLKESGVSDFVGNFLNDYAKRINGAHNLVKKAEADLTKVQRDEQKSREATLKEHQGNIDRVRQQMLADLRTNITQQQATLAKANKDYLAAKKQREDITAEFRAASKEFATATTAAGEPSFGALNSAKVSARQKLTAGDTKGAITEAQRALQILRDLREAGANEYGFAGVAKELEAIATQAANVEEKTQNVKVALAELEIKSLRDQADALSNIKVGFGLDAENLEQLRAQMAEIAKGLTAQMIIPVTVVPPAEMGAPGVPTAPELKLPGFAEGGRLRGPGTGTSDSILMWGSNGEYMVRADAVRHYGQALLDQLNAKRLPRFAEGGVVGGRSLPAIPPPAPSLTAPAAEFPHLGSLDISVDGRTFRTYAEPSVAEEIRLQSRLRGKGQGGNR
ncbi:tape measure domain protein [compost metagenome]